MSAQKFTKIHAVSRSRYHMAMWQLQESSMRKFQSWDDAWKMTEN